MVTFCQAHHSDAGGIDQFYCGLIDGELLMDLDDGYFIINFDDESIGIHIGVNNWTQYKIDWPSADHTQKSITDILFITWGYITEYNWDNRYNW